MFNISCNLYKKGEQNFEKLEEICNVAYQDFKNQIDQECKQKGEYLQILWNQKEKVLKKKFEDVVIEYSKSERNSIKSYIMFESKFSSEIDRKNEKILTVLILFMKIF